MRFFLCHLLISAAAIIGLRSCKDHVGKNTLTGRWKVKQVVGVMSDDTAFTKQWKNKEAELLQSYRELSFIFKEDSSFRRTLPDCSHENWMCFEGKLQPNTLGDHQWMLYQSCDSINQQTVCVRVLMDSIHSSSCLLTDVVSNYGFVNYVIQKEE